MKRRTYVIITGLVLIFVAGAFWITNSTNQSDQKATQTEPLKKQVQLMLKPFHQKLRKP